MSNTPHHMAQNDPHYNYPNAPYQDDYAPAPAPAPSYDTGRPRRPRGVAADRSALVIHTIADIAAGFLGLWLLLYLLDANQANVFVDFVHGLAGWLAGWSQDIFTMRPEGLRVVLNYALPALVYLAVGHGAAAWVRRLS
jgi:hypothetical protein